MKIAILIGSPEHPVWEFTQNYYSDQIRDGKVMVTNDLNRIDYSDLLFLVSYPKIIDLNILMRFRKVFVLHASDLPKGRGWSPHIWEIIDGAESITLTILEAAAGVDTGDIWGKVSVPIAKNLLFHEINSEIFKAELRLIDYVFKNFDEIVPKAQSSELQPSYYRKREPGDSEIDISIPIKSQFDLIRVADSARYPAFFIIEGTKYNLYIEKDNE
ncbi:formyltransferase family protein [Gammaproteobacteria bacterium]|nr:formyltransferase family protein [Gammaproteobacteria bacterium]